MLQILIAILAGILTIGAPCILPLLPILLGTSIGQTSRTRPLFITLGFILTFALLGLLFAVFTKILGLSQDALRNIAIILLGLFGLFMILPNLFEKLIQYMGKYIDRANQIGAKAGSGNWGGFVLGLVLGIVWTPCAGPVLGSILTLVATQTDLARAGILLTAYAIGAGLPMLIIAYGGQLVTTKVRAFAKYTNIIQKAFGFLILALAVAMYFKYDILLQTKILQFYPSLNPKF
ncbi:MAG: cytochrome c biogenesis CcdA family protein [Candidatus Doudnabacteria bacterium]